MINYEENVDVYLKALAKWGEGAQRGMMFEELGELATAINQYERGRITKYDLASEFADVMLMTHQLMTMYDIFEDVNRAFEYKFDRFLTRVNNE